MERVQAFVDAVVAKDFVQSIRNFYAEDATAQENLQPPRFGREALVAHETKRLRSMGKVEPQFRDSPSAKLREKLPAKAT